MPTILIIRHAEKPNEIWPGPGLTVNGTPDGNSLVIRGWQRAGSWAALFGTALGGPEYPQPVAVYAADPYSDASSAIVPSARPFETITPLAARLGLAPDLTHALGAETVLAAAVLQTTGVVLICWEHKAIINSLIPAILHGQGCDGLPTQWDKYRFDVVLRFDRTDAQAPWLFRQMFPCLLSGDSATPMR